MTNLPITIPALAFYDGYGRRAGIEMMQTFWSEHEFRHMQKSDLRCRTRIGMLLVDSAGKAWKVVDVTPLRLTRQRWWWMLIEFLLRDQSYEVEHLLEPLPPMPLQAVKDRVCVDIAANPDDFRDDELIAGEAGEPIEEEVLLQALYAHVQAATSFKGVMDALETPYEDLVTITSRSK